MFAACDCSVDSTVVVRNSSVDNTVVVRDYSVGISERFVETFSHGQSKA